MAILAKYDSGESIEDICRVHQISPATFYNWRKDKAIEEDAEKRRLKQLEKENDRLKKMYSELMIDHKILQEGYEIVKKISARDKKKH